MRSSFHSLIPFLPLLCNCQFWRLDSIQCLCSKAHILAGWRLETRFNSMPLFPSSYHGRLESRNSTQFNASAPKLISWQAGVSKLYSIQRFCSQAGVSKLDSSLHPMLLLPASELSFILITTLHGPRRKRSLYIVGKVCLQRRCIATEVTPSLLAYSLPRDVFIKSLPNNELLFWFHYFGFWASCHNVVCAFAILRLVTTKDVRHNQCMKMSS
jgi:hypothetical protein